MDDLIYIFRGVLIGLMVSVPLGPMGVLIIQKTLHRGALSGFVAGMGAAFADLFYAVMAAFGLGLVVDTIQTHEILFQVVGGIFLLIMGLRIYFANPLKRIKSKRRVTKKGLLGDFLSLFFLTASNPVTVIIFMAVFAGTSVLGGNSSGRLSAIMVLAGVLLGSAAWWYTLSTVVNIFRKRFKLRVLISINRISGIVIAILGGFVILLAFEPFRSMIPA